MEVANTGGTTLITFFPFPYRCWITKDNGLCVFKLLSELHQTKEVILNTMVNFTL